MDYSKGVLAALLIILMAGCLGGSQTGVKEPEEPGETMSNISGVDSDGDRLPDTYEKDFTLTDPRNADSNSSATPTDESDNSLRDGDEDLDDDGLNNFEELKLRTDPLTNDTDDDGSIDGNEEYTTTATEERLGIRVNITGQGYLADDVILSDASNLDVIFGSHSPEGLFASEAVHMDSGRPFVEAEITIEYNESRLTSESEVGMYRYNENTKRYEKVPSDVDTENDKVTARVARPSVFVVFDEARWEEVQNRMVDW
jgi:hypothetical protein